MLFQSKLVGHLRNEVGMLGVFSRFPSENLKTINFWKTITSHAISRTRYLVLSDIIE